jgi:organic hydroperoxide reductase OsmC/OhrA
MEEGEFKVKLFREERFRFKVSFGADQIPELRMDEPAPLGSGDYPNAGKLLAAAVGNCLCSSLIFCMDRSHAEVNDICAEVYSKLERNEKGRWRITGIRVNIFPQVDDEVKYQRCRELFEDFCIVTQSVRQGIEVAVEVYPVKPGAPPVPTSGGLTQGKT